MKKLLETPLGMVGTGVALGIFFLLIASALSFFVGYTGDGDLEEGVLWLAVLLILVVFLNFVAFLALFLYFGYVSAKRHGLGVVESGFRVATVYAGITVVMLVVHVLLLYVVGTTGATLILGDQVASDEFALETGKTIGEQICNFTISLLVGTPINFGVGALGALLAGKQKKGKTPSTSKPKKKS